VAASFGKLLRQYRRAAGLTQARLAELSGVSAQAISMLERGTRMYPRQDTVELLAEALELPDIAIANLRHAASRSDAGSRGIGVPSQTRIEPDSPPRWLPPAVSDFTGRDRELADLRDVLASASEAPAVVVTTIEGMGGVGKTTLAVRAAHLVADEFPDGQLYVNLRGFGPGERMSTAEALDQILASLGLSAGDSGAVEQSSGRYRSALAGRRVLVVLDNASDAAQVSPLLPGTAGCAAIVTSRQSMAGLPGARHVRLDLMTEDEGAELLSATIGADRAAAESAAVAEVVRRCGRLPLAIRIAGARLASRPSWPVAVLAQQLADERSRLDELELRDAGVRASFFASLRGLAESIDAVDNDAAAAFSLLGVLDSPQICLDVVTRLVDKPIASVRRVLERLVDSHLLESQEIGRYRLHDLLRTYAREHAESHLTQDERAAALERVLILYNTVAWRVYLVSSPAHTRLQYVDRRWVDDTVNGVGVDHALSWLIEEGANIVSTMRQAAEHSAVPDALITQLALVSLNHLNTGGHWPLLVATGRVSLRVADRTGNRIAQAFAHHDIGAAHLQVGRGDDALTEFEAAVELFRAEVDQSGEAMALCNLAHVFERLGRIEEGIRAGNRALAISADHGLKHLEATTCLALGLLHGLADERSQELRYHERSLSIYAEIGYDRGRARALYNFGVACRNAGRTEEATANLRESIKLTDRLDLVDTSSEARSELAAVYCATGRPDLALTLGTEALSIALMLGSEITEARARHCVGNALDALQRRNQARREWYAAQLIYERLGAPTADEIRLLLAVAD
jgi:tetratricopeptide (TPR) repeat protein/transcriptional regulator with XRE-family HTH domain